MKGRLMAESSASAGVVDLYTGRGSCRGCGECCGRFVPLSALDVERLRGFARRSRVETAPLATVDGDSLTLNMNCPFLVDGLCSVYEARPEVCREYRCDLHRNGSMRVPFGVAGMEVRDMREIAMEVGAV